MQSCFSSSSEYKIDSGICKCFSSNCQAKVYDNVEGEENNEICPKWCSVRASAGISLQKLSTAHAKSRPSHWSRHRHSSLLIGGDTDHVHLLCPGTKLVPDKPSKLSHTFRCRRLQINGLGIGQLRGNLFSHWSLGCKTRVRLTRGRAWKMHLIIIRPTSQFQAQATTKTYLLKIFEIRKRFNHLIKG